MLFYAVGTPSLFKLKGNSCIHKTMAVLGFLWSWFRGTAEERAAAAKKKEAREQLQATAAASRQKEKEARKRLQATAAAARRKAKATAEAVRQKYKAEDEARVRKYKEEEERRLQTYNNRKETQRVTRITRISTAVDEAFLTPTDADITKRAEACKYSYDAFIVENALGSDPCIWSVGRNLLKVLRDGVGREIIIYSPPRWLHRGKFRSWCASPNGKERIGDSICAACLREYIFQKLPPILNGAVLRKRYNWTDDKFILRYEW
jgi:hypothetical protein